MPIIQTFLRPKWIRILLILLGYGLIAWYGYYLYQRTTTPSIQQTPVASTTKLMPAMNAPKQFRNLGQLFGAPEQKLNVYKPTSWKLTGIITQDDGKHVVIIKIKNKEKIFQEGDRIDQFTVVEDIEKDAVVIRHKQEKKLMTLFHPTKFQRI